MRQPLAARWIWAAMVLLTGGAVRGTAILSEIVCTGAGCNSSSSSGLITTGQSTTPLMSLAEAWAQDYSTLKAYAQVDAVNLPNGGFDDVSGTATSVDRLYFPGETSGTVSFTFDFSGTTSFGIDYGREEVDFAAGPNSSNSTNYLLYRKATDGFSNVPLVATLTVTLPYNVFLDYQFSLTSLVDCEAVPNSIACNGSGTVDFLETAKLVHIDVFDSTGQLVTAPVITSDSGFNYSRLTTEGTAVPEPGTLVSVVLAIGGWSVLEGLKRAQLRISKLASPTRPCALD